MKRLVKKNGSRILASLLAVLLLAAPLAAFAAQSNADIDASVATRAGLESIVKNQVDGVYNTVKGELDKQIINLINSAVGDKNAIKDLARPIVKDAVKLGLLSYDISHPDLDTLIDQTVDEIIDSAFVDAILDSEFVKAVIDRTVRYATEEITNRLGITADRDNQIASISDHIWNAPLVSVPSASTRVKSDVPVVVAAGVVGNTSYYNFSVVSWNTIFGIKTTAKEINVSGWNSTNISVYITGTVGLSSISKIGTYTGRLNSLNYQQIIFEAGQRAIVDEITDRINAIILKGKTSVLTCLEGKLSQVGVNITLDPNESFRQIADNIEAALRAKAEQDVQNAKAELENMFRRLLTC